MQKHFFKCTLMILCLSLNAVFAETLGSQDSPLYAQPSKQSSIVRMVSAGSEFKVIQKDDKKGFVMVKLPTGEEGWVNAAALASTTPNTTTRSETSTATEAQTDDRAADLSAESVADETVSTKIEKAEAASALQGLGHNGWHNLKRFSAKEGDSFDETVEKGQSLELISDKTASFSMSRDAFFAGGVVLLVGLLVGYALGRRSARATQRWF